MKKTPPLFLFWTATIYLLALLSSSQTFFNYSYESTSIIKENLPEIRHLLNFDGGHYQNISHFGYIKKFQTAFFPLYPALIKLVGLLTHSHLTAALLISLICTHLSLRLISKAHPRSGLKLIFFPLSFFFLTGYGESLFLLLSLLSWRFFRQKKYLRSGLMGFFAALCRFYGILLFPCLLLEHFLSKNQPQKALSLFLIPLGLLSYMVYLQYAYQDPFAFIHALSLWNKSNLTFPPQTVYRYLKILTTVSPAVIQYWIALLEFAGLIFALSVSYILYRQKQFSYSLYVFLGSIIPGFTGTLQSLPRYLIVLFPIYFMKIPPKLRLPLYALGFILQITLLTAFLTGRFVA